MPFDLDTFLDQKLGAPKERPQSFDIDSFLDANLGPSRPSFTLPAEAEAKLRADPVFAERQQRAQDAADAARMGPPQDAERGIEEAGTEPLQDSISSAPDPRRHTIIGEIPAAIRRSIPAMELGVTQALRSAGDTHGGGLGAQAHFEREMERQAVLPSSPDASLASRAAHAVARTVGGAIPYIAAAGAGPVGLAAGGAMAGLTGYGESGHAIKDQLIAQGVPEADAADIAADRSIAPGAIAALGTFLGTGAATQSIAKTGAKALAKKIAESVGAGSFQSAAQDLAQQGQEINAGARKDIDWSSVGKSAAEGGATFGVLAGAHQAGSAIASRIAQSGRTGKPVSDGGLRSETPPQEPVPGVPTADQPSIAREAPAAPSVTPQTATPEVQGPPAPTTGDRVFRLFDTAEQAALQRLKERAAIPRSREAGATTLPQDIVDASVIVASRAAKLGVRAGQGLTQLAKDTIEEIGSKLNPEEVSGFARGILRRMRQEGTPEEVTLAKLDRGVHELPGAEARARLQDLGVPDYVLNPGHKGRVGRASVSEVIDGIVRGEARDLPDQARLYAVLDQEARSKDTSSGGGFIEIPAASLHEGDAFRLGRWEGRVERRESDPFTDREHITLALETPDALDLGQQMRVTVPTDAAIPLSRDTLVRERQLVPMEPAAPRSRLGVLNSDAIERVLSEIHQAQSAPVEPIKARVRRATGQVTDEAATLTPSQALAGQMKAAERASESGFRAGRKAGLEEGKALAESGPPETLKGRVRRITGVDANEAPTITESEALVQRYKAEQKAANAAFYEGKRAGLTKAQERIDALLDKMEGMRTDAAISEGFRDSMKRYAIENLPIFVRGKLLNAIANITDVKGAQRALMQAHRELAVYDLRTTLDRGLTTSTFRATATLPAEARERARAINAELRGLRDTAEMKAALGVMDAQARLKGQSATEIAGAEFRIKTQALRAAADRATELVNELTEIRHRATKDKQVMIGDRAMRTERVRQAIIDGVANHPDAKVRGGLETNPEVSLVKRGRNALLNNDGLGALLGSPEAQKLLSENLWAAETRKHAQTFRDRDAFAKIMADNGYPLGRRETIALSQHTAGKDATRTTIDLPDAGKITATPMELAALYGTITDANARQQILKGAPIEWERATLGRTTWLSASDIATLERSIPEPLRRIVDQWRAYAEENIRKPLFKAVRDFRGYEPEAVENYYPTRRDRVDADPLPNMTATQYAQQQLQSMGFLKTRVKAANRPYIIGDFAMDVRRQSEKSALVTHFLDPIHDAQRVFADRDIKQAIAGKMGAKLVEQIDRTIDRAKQLDARATTPGEAVLQWVKSHYSQAKLLLSPSVMFKQLGGIPKLSTVVDARSIAASSLAAFKSPEVAEVMRSSGYFRDRYEDGSWRRFAPGFDNPSNLLGTLTTPQEIGEFVKRSATGRPAAAIKSIDNLVERVRLLNWFDQIAARSAIAAKLYEGEQRGLSGQALRDFAAREAEFAIRRTNATSSVLDMADAAARHRGTAYSTLFMFMSDASKDLNLLVGQDRATQVRRIAAITINNAWAAAVTTAMGVGLTQAARAMFGDDPTYAEQKKRASLENSAAEAFTLNLAKNSVGFVPLADFFVGVAFETYRGMTGRKTNYESLAGRNPLTENAVSLLRATSDLQIAAELATKDRTFDEQERLKTRLRSAAEKAALTGADLLGIPLGAPYQLGKRVYRAVPKNPAPLLGSSE